jgi:chromosome segregation ATPase
MAQSQGLLQGLSNSLGQLQQRVQLNATNTVQFKNQLDAIIAALNNSIEPIRIKLRDLNASASQLNELQQRLQQAQNQNQELTRRLQDTTEDRDRIRKQLESIQSGQQDLIQQIAALTEQITSQISAIQALDPTTVYTQQMDALTNIQQTLSGIANANSQRGGKRNKKYRHTKKQHKQRGGYIYGKKKSYRSKTLKSYSQQTESE